MNRVIGLCVVLAAGGCGASGSCGSVALPADCPATAPANGDDCRGHHGCRYYESSCSAGTDAVCDAGHWHVTPWDHARH